MKPTSQNFNRLLEARLPENILNALTICCWEALGNRGEPPPVTTRELLTCDKSLFEIRENISAETLIRELLLLYNQKISQSTDIEITRLQAHLSIDSLTRMSRDEIRNASNKLDDTEEQVNLENQAASIFQRVHDFFAAFAGLQITKDPLEAKEHIQVIHDIWMFARESNNKLQHPLAPIVREWLKEQTAKPVTGAYDALHPVAIIKNPMGSVREIAFTEQETGQVFKTPERVEQVQMELDLGETPSVLPAIMPLQVVRTANLKPQTKSGAVSHELRIFFEAMMALQPNQQRADLMLRLGDLIDFLYPNGKFNWTNQIPHIERALWVLKNNATIPWIDDQGDLREWTPVVMRSLLPSKPTRDTPIFFDVQMPPDAKQGYLVIKDIHRRKGMKSSSQWNAYHVACYLWDKHATVKRKLIDPTRPVDRRDGQNRLVDASGKPLVNRKGNPINSPYHPEAIHQLDREPNPEALNRYPVLSFEELILACFPNGYTPSARREYLRRAKAHWRQLEVDGEITIKAERSGWRILPTATHLNAYRALKRAKKGVY